MKFQIENGLGIISIHVSEIGCYFRCRRPLAAVWDDCMGSVGKYLCLLPYDKDYRNEVRSRLIGQLNEDYTGRTAELKELLDPLLRLFPGGEYALAYHRGADGKYFQYTSYRDNHEKTHYHNLYLKFSPVVDIRDKELKIKEHRQYLAEIDRTKYYSLDLLGYTTAGFYEGDDIVLVATLPESQIDQERVKYFENEISNGARPFAIIFNCYFHQIQHGGDDSLHSASYVIDGHHKLLAYNNLKIRPSIVELTYYPAGREDIEFNVEELISVLFPWQVEHILKNWYKKENYILKYLQNPDSPIHRFIKNGHVRTFHENGQPAHEAFYINDRIEGEARWWYENGQLQRVEYYRDGIRYGEWKSWYQSGAIQSVQSFNEKGNYEGHMVSYYESGRVRHEQFLKNAVNIDGYSYLCWFEDGTKETELEYLNGLMIKRKNYNRSGEMVNFEEFDPEMKRLVKRM